MLKTVLLVHIVMNELTTVVVVDSCWVDEIFDDVLLGDIAVDLVGELLSRFVESSTVLVLDVL